MVISDIFITFVVINENKRTLTHYMKILLMRFSALGDVAMVAPVLRQMAEKYPDAEITMLSQPFCQPIFEGIAPNVRFIGADIKREYKGIPGLYRLFKELHVLHFDFVFDLHDVLRTKFLRKVFRMHGYKVYKIDKHRKLRKTITAAEPKKVLRQLPTSFQNYADCLTSGGFAIDASAQPGVDRTKPISRIGIAPFAAHQGKIFPTEKMEEVIRLLPEKEIILFGGGGIEKEIMQRWENTYPNVERAATVLQREGREVCLREELSLMRTLDVMVSMDSANMHLASLVGLRVISIWGATHPFAGFLGWGQSMDDCIQLPLPCRPCSIYGNKPCRFGDMRCMTGITAKDVVGSLEV